jgi:hypothetical protein
MKENHERSALVEYVFSDFWRHVVQAVVTVLGLVFVPTYPGMIALTNVGIVQRYMMQRMRVRLDIFKLSFVSVLTLVLSDWMVRRASESTALTTIVFTSWMVGNIYWISDTIAWNTLVNIAACASHVFNN